MVPTDLQFSIHMFGEMAHPQWHSGLMQCGGCCNTVSAWGFKIPLVRVIPLCIASLALFQICNWRNHPLLNLPMDHIGRSYTAGLLDTRACWVEANDGATGTFRTDRELAGPIAYLKSLHSCVGMSTGRSEMVSANCHGASSTELLQLDCLRLNLALDLPWRIHQGGKCATTVSGGRRTAWARPSNNESGRGAACDAVHFRSH